MATLNMDNYSSIQDSEKKIGPAKQNGRVKCLIDEITLAADVAANDELLMSKLPETAVILDAYIKSGNLGTQGKFDLGLKAHQLLDGSQVAEDQDSLVFDADAGGQAVKQDASLSSVALGSQIGKGGAQPFLTCTESSDAGTGVKVQVVIVYSLP